VRGSSALLVALAVLTQSRGPEPEVLGRSGALLLLFRSSEDGVRAGWREVAVGGGTEAPEAIATASLNEGQRGEARRGGEPGWQG